jgi:hypothetical protein
VPTSTRRYCFPEWCLYQARIGCNEYKDKRLSCKGKLREFRDIGEVLKGRSQPEGNLGNGKEFATCQRRALDCCTVTKFDPAPLPKAMQKILSQVVLAL